MLVMLNRLLLLKFLYNNILECWMCGPVHGGLTLICVVQYVVLLSWAAAGSADSRALAW